MGGIVGGVGGAILVAGCALAVVKLRGALKPSGDAVAPGAFPEVQLSQPTSPLSPNTVAASPFLPAAHPAPYSAARA